MIVFSSIYVRFINGTLTQSKPNLCIDLGWFEGVNYQTGVYKTCGLNKMSYTCVCQNMSKRKRPKQSIMSNVPKVKHLDYGSSDRNRKFKHFL